MVREKVSRFEMHAMTTTSQKHPMSIRGFRTMLIVQRLFCTPAKHSPRTDSLHVLRQISDPTSTKLKSNQAYTPTLVINSCRGISKIASSVLSSGAPPLPYGFCSSSLMRSYF